ncbi:cytidylyltransferase domain-containing protein [Candidatus Stoquefichus sp. SB1]|uniref:cytidylyltransferase domain-containing protein n=1 Tax=Candidatus Stoquefichus sp. SB1 TaxID=1658109 RepID=UPI00067F2356|nr:GDSL-type esterase/lipase family protein [Candidatus Stoquefichus sp. SB1]
MKKIAIIPARSGSKGLPHKNILNLYGKPLIAWTIEAAVKSNQFDKIIVSTDSKQYGKISEEYGAEVIYRDESISNDTASTYDVLKDLFSKVDVSYIDYFVLLQPTSPFRNAEHINEAIKLYEKNYYQYDTLVSVTEAHKSSDLIKPLDKDRSLKYFNNDFSNYKRQQYHEYEPNGAIYISKIQSYLKIKQFLGSQGIAYIMNEDDSIDIDGRNDFELAYNVISRKNIIDERRKIVKERILEKKQLEISVKHPITLIGNSFFDNWNVEKICNKKVNNWGIKNATSKLYLKYFLNDISFDELGEYILVMFGINELLCGNSINDTVSSINHCIEKIRTYHPHKIIFVNMLNVNGRIDIGNELVNECKQCFSKSIKADKIIQTDDLNDEFGWLNKDYTDDGLYLNAKGYDFLLSIIEKEILNNL